jgi:hypothetical protein
LIYDVEQICWRAGIFLGFFVRVDGFQVVNGVLDVLRAACFPGQLIGHGISEE